MAIYHLLLLYAQRVEAFLYLYYSLWTYTY